MEPHTQGGCLPESRRQHTARVAQTTRRPAPGLQLLHPDAPTHVGTGWQGDQTPIAGIRLLSPPQNISDELLNLWATARGPGRLLSPTHSHKICLRPGAKKFPKPQIAVNNDRMAASVLQTISETNVPCSRALKSPHPHSLPKASVPSRPPI